MNLVQEKKFACPLRAAVGRVPFPVRHFALAAAAFWVSAVGLFLGRNDLMGFSLDARWTLGCVHLLTLGWITATLLGAMSQMLPAHAGAPLRFPWAPAAGFWLLAAGLALFVGELWGGNARYWHGPALAACALSLYLASYVPTLWSAAKLPFTEKHFAASFGFLASLAAAGLLLAVDRQRGIFLASPDRALIAHIHLALLGWVTLPIVGASYRLFFPAAASRAQNRTASRAVFALIVAGTAGLAVDAFWFSLSAARLWATLLAAAYVAYATQLRPLRRAEWKLDPPMGFSLLGMAGGAAWAAMGVALAFGVLEDEWEARAAYGVCALLGWATPWVMGQAHKIFPFLVWRSAYADDPSAPAFDSMGRPALAWTALACLALGWPLLAAGLLAESQAGVTAGLALVLACATAYAVQAGLWLSHLPRRR